MFRKCHADKAGTPRGPAPAAANGDRRDRRIMIDNLRASGCAEPPVCRHTTGVAPPSMLIAVPVVNPAWSLHRKQAIAANSSALPIRPNGTLAPIFAVNSSYDTLEPSR